MRDPLGGSVYRIATAVLALTVPTATLASQVPEPHRRDSAGIEVVLTDLTDRTSVPHCTIGRNPVLTIGHNAPDSRYELFQVEDARRLSDGRLAVLNRGSQEIRVFDAASGFQFNMGSDGEGPGEFRDPIEIDAIGLDTTVVFDWRLGRLSFFDPNGSYSRSVRLEPFGANPTGYFDAVTNGSYFIIGFHTVAPLQGSSFDPEYLNLIRYDSQGQVVDTAAMLPYGRRGWIDRQARMAGGPVFQARGVFAANERGLLTANGADPEIQMRGEAGDIRRIIRWTTPDRRVTEAEIRRYRQDRLARATSDDARSRVLRTLDVLPFARVFPSVRQVFLSDNGDIWVNTFPRPAAVTSEWLRFGGTGGFVCVLAIPLNMKVFQFNDNFLVALLRDDMDIEAVAVFQVFPSDA